MIQLYKAGNIHTIGGIECEACNFTIRQLEEKLKDGWVKSPQEIGNGNETQEDAEEESEAVPEEENVESQQEEDKVLNPIRQKAKDAGIDGWENKRINTLEGLLDELKD